MNKSLLVILAAGIGSRMPETTNHTNKCIVDLGRTTPLEHTIKAFSDAGVKDVLIVVGHYKDKVIEKIRNSPVASLLNNLIFVANSYYNHHGCEFSVSLSANHMQEYDTVYITEGDLILHPSYINSIIRSTEESCILLRDSTNILETKSVIAVSNSNENKVTRFVYDPDHQNTTRFVESTERILGESMQIWKFSRYSKVMLQKYLQEYLKKAESSDIPQLETGLYSINRVLEDTPMTAIKLEGSEWINLNTSEDVNKGRKLPWLERF